MEQPTQLSKADKTRAFIIEKSSVLFNTKGYRDTSLSDIIEQTGLTKGSIYGNFENKDELAIAVYQYNFDALMARLDTVLDEKTKAYDKLMAFTGYYRENWAAMFERGGCPVLNASIEADDNFEVLKQQIQSSINSWVGKLCAIIESGQKNGEFKREIIATAYAYSIITLLEGGIMLGKIMNSHQLLSLALDRIDIMVINEMKR